MGKKGIRSTLLPWEGSIRTRRSTEVDSRPEERTDWLTICTSQSWGPAWRRQAPLLAEKYAEIDRRTVEALTPPVSSAGLLTIKPERDLHRQLPPCCTSQSEGVNAPTPLNSTPQPGARSGQRFSLFMQRHSKLPEVWSRQSLEDHCQCMHWPTLQEHTVAKCWILGRQALGRSTQWLVSQ